MLRRGGVGPLLDQLVPLHPDLILTLVLKGREKEQGFIHTSTITLLGLFTAGFRTHMDYTDALFSHRMSLPVTISSMDEVALDVTYVCY